MFQTYYGPDVSVYQGIINWPVLNPGAAFVLIKSSGSDDGNYLDPNFESNIDQARNYGNALPRGVYHFCGGTDALDDASYFVSAVGNNLQVGELYLFDCERGAAVTPSYALQALSAAKAALGWAGGVYVSQNRLVTEDWSAVAAAGYFVWPADWAVSPSADFSVGAFNTYSFQQYTDSATWPGIQGACDGDCFFAASITDWFKFGKPATPVVPPVVTPATPTPPVVAPTPPAAPPAQPAPVVPATPPTPIVPPPMKKPSWFERFLDWFEETFFKKGES